DEALGALGQATPLTTPEWVTRLMLSANANISLLEGNLQPGKRSSLGQVQANLLGLGIHVESRSQIIPATSRNVLRQLESCSALRRYEVAVTEEVHAQDVAGHKESLGGIEADFRADNRERDPYRRGGKGRRLRHAIVHLG